MRCHSALEVSCFLYVLDNVAHVVEDWLNPSFANTPDQTTTMRSPSQSDFRFTYLGPRGTFTPLHRDVYASYSWSANIVGRKLWWLFPPDPAILVKLGIANPGHKGERSGGVVFDVRDLNDIDGCMKVVQKVSSFLPTVIL
jgi:hypothetical protein